MVFMFVHIYPFQTESTDHQDSMIYSKYLTQPEFLFLTLVCHSNPSESLKQTRWFSLAECDVAVTASRFIGLLG